MPYRSRPVRKLGATAVAILTTCLYALGAQAGSAAPVSAESDASKPFIVKIHADWCGVCQRLTPTFDALNEKLGDGARFVVFDVTDKETAAASRDEADRLGIRSFFDSHKSKTGTIAVLHGATREPVVVLGGVTDTSRYEAAVAIATGSGA